MTSMSKKPKNKELSGVTFKESYGVAWRVLAVAILAFILIQLTEELVETSSQQSRVQTEIDYWQQTDVDASFTIRDYSSADSGRTATTDFTITREGTNGIVKSSHSVTGGYSIEDASAYHELLSRIVDTAKELEVGRLLEPPYSEEITNRYNNFDFIAEPDRITELNSMSQLVEVLDVVIVELDVELRNLAVLLAGLGLVNALLLLSVARTALRINRQALRWARVRRSKQMIILDQGARTGKRDGHRVMKPEHQRLADTTDDYADGDETERQDTSQQPRKKTNSTT